MITGPSFMTTVYPPTVSRAKEKKIHFHCLTELQLSYCLLFKQIKSSLTRNANNRVRSDTR